MASVQAPRWSALAYGDEQDVQRVLDGVRAARRDPRQRVAVEVVNEPGKIVIGASDRAIFDDAIAALTRDGIPTGAFQLQPPEDGLGISIVRAGVLTAVVAGVYVFLISDVGARFLDAYPTVRAVYVAVGPC